MTDKEALKLALEALKEYCEHGAIFMPLTAVKALEEALAAPVQPVAWTLLLVGEHHGIIGKAGEKFLGHPEHYERIDVYTTPPAAQRQWVGLSQNELDAMFSNTIKGKKLVNWVARAIEAKLKEKNT
jgi:hypothetical protein